MLPQSRLVPASAGGLGIGADCGCACRAAISSTLSQPAWKPRSLPGLSGLNVLQDQEATRDQRWHVGWPDQVPKMNRSDHSLCGGVVGTHSRACTNSSPSIVGALIARSMARAKCSARRGGLLVVDAAVKRSVFMILAWLRRAEVDHIVDSVCSLRLGLRPPLYIVGRSCTCNPTLHRPWANTMRSPVPGRPRAVTCTKQRSPEPSLTGWTSQSRFFRSITGVVHWTGAANSITCS